MRRVMHGWGRRIAFVFAVLGAVWGGTQSWAAPQAAAAGVVNIVAQHSGRCLEAEKSSQQSDIPIVQADCVGQGGAIWTLTASPTGGDAVRLLNVNSNLCLTAPRPTEGGAVQQGACTREAGADLRFVDRGSHAWIQPAAATTPLCLEATAGATTAGVPIRVASCSGQRGSAFHQRPAGAGNEVPVNAAPIVDFNGDGVQDVAIGDPKATVAGYAEAGAVRVVYGGAKGTVQIDESVSYLPGGTEAGDRFGHALATVDYNQDGYTDLVIGAPYEDTTPTITDVGTVVVVYGASGGLGTGLAGDAYVQGNGTGAIKAAAKEKGDLMGYSLAAGRTRDGAPFILVGAPGDTVGGKKNAGAVYYLRGGTSVSLAQGSGMTGSSEEGDKAGWSVAADANNIAVGGPGEDIDAVADGGTVWVFSHPGQASARPAERADIHQNAPNVSGGSEAGDALGTSVALVENGPDGESILAVGVPGESLTAANGTISNNSGSVMVFHVPATGPWSEQQVINQDVQDVADSIEANDRFGETLQAINLSPRTAPTWETLQLVVGVPGEAHGAVTAAGGVHTMSLVGPPGAHNDILFGGRNGVPATPAANERAGQAIGVSATHVYVGMPTGPHAQGAVYAVPWQNVASHTTTSPDLPVTVYQPGKDGIPTGGKAFGSAIR